jgi:hypothetical protein
MLIFSDAVSGWAEFGRSVNPSPTEGQIMPTTLLLAHPDLKALRHLGIIYQAVGGSNNFGFWLL